MIEKKYELGKGFYIKPHGLFDLVKEGSITKAEYLLLDILFHLQNLYNSKGKFFFQSDEDIISTKLISPRTLTVAKRGLYEKGVIDLEKGYSHHATDYKILITIKADARYFIVHN